MIWTMHSESLFIRLDPGDELLSGIRDACVAADVSEAFITSGVGMLRSVRFGFFQEARDDYDETLFEGIFDLSLVCGNVTKMGEATWPHVHVVVNDPEHHTLSGHLLAASVHITVELILQKVDLQLSRQKVAGCPATRILVPSELR